MSFRTLIFKTKHASPTQEFSGFWLLEWKLILKTIAQLIDILPPEMGDVWESRGPGVPRPECSMSSMLTSYSTIRKRTQGGATWHPIWSECPYSLALLSICIYHVRSWPGENLPCDRYHTDPDPELFPPQGVLILVSSSPVARVQVLRKTEHPFIV